MGWRALGIVLALVVLGLAAGALIGYQQRATVEDAASPQPVSAVSPSIPIDPPVVAVPDPDLPPLRTDLATRPANVGGDDFGVTVPVPREWLRTDIGSAESRWTLPGNPGHTYSLRVEMVDGLRRPIPDIMEGRLGDLEDLTEFTTRSQSADTLVFSFIDETGHRRLQLLRWLQPRATGTAEVEIAVVGRMVDRPGLVDLMQNVTDRAGPA